MCSSITTTSRGTTCTNQNVYSTELYNSIDVEPEQFSCICCDYKSHYRVKVYEHYNKAHNLKTGNSKTGTFCEEIERYPCDRCSYEYNSSLSYVKHHNLCVRKPTREPQIAAEEAEGMGSSGLDEIVASRDVGAVESHVSTYYLSGKIAGFQCNHCSYRAKQGSTLKRHLLKHVTNEEISWFQCSYRTKQKSDLKADLTLREVVSSADTVDFLLDHRFSLLSHDDKIFLKNTAIPKPPMPDLLQTRSGGRRSFANSWFKKIAWLTGSPCRNKLFCWYCLLFSRDNKSPWSTVGFDNLKDISRAIIKHDISTEHIHAALKFKLFGKKNNIIGSDSAHRESIKRHNEMVRQNRMMIKHLINMVLFLATQELAFRGHEESSNLVNQGNFRKLAKFGATLDPNFKNFIDPPESSVFSGLSKTMQNELINSIVKIIMDKIHDEIDKTPCFSWVVDETSDIRCSSQMSVIFRFFSEGSVVERLLGFFDVTNHRKAEDLFNLLSQNFSRFDIEKKLVGQTYDGAAVMAGEINELQAKIKSVAPQALIMPCYAHKLNLILQDTSKTIKECRLFFSNVGGFSAFFTKSAKRTNLLDQICEERLLSNSDIRWNFKSRAVDTLFENRNNLLAVFGKIIDDSDNWDDISIRESQGLKNVLNDYDFLFLLFVFNMILLQTEGVFSLAQNKLSDVQYCNGRIQAVLLTLKKYRNEEFYYQNLLSLIQNLTEIPPPLGRRRKTNISQENYYKRLYLEILDLIIDQIEIRFQNMPALDFLDLLNHSKFETFHRRFPHQLLNSLISSYPRFFHKDKLQRELEILYSDVDSFGSSPGFANMAKFMYVNEIIDVVPEIYNLLGLILSLPVTSGSAEESFSKKIKTLTRESMGQSRLNNLSIIAVERGLVKELSETETFYENVIDDFANTKTRRVELIYKNV